MTTQEDGFRVHAWTRSLSRDSAARDSGSVTTHLGDFAAITRPSQRARVGVRHRATLLATLDLRRGLLQSGGPSSLARPVMSSRVADAPSALQVQRGANGVLQIRTRALAIDVQEEYDVPVEVMHRLLRVEEIRTRESGRCSPFGILAHGLAAEHAIVRRGVCWRSINVVALSSGCEIVETRVIEPLQPVDVEWMKQVIAAFPV